MREVADGDCALLLDVGEEGTAVLHEEVVDAVLIGQLEGLGVEGGLGARARWDQVQAVEGREHAELELEVVACCGRERLPVVADPFGHLDRIVHIVLDAVDTGVYINASKEDAVGAVGRVLLGALVEEVCDRTSSQHTGFLESPGGQLLSECAVACLGVGLVAGKLDSGVEPSVLESFAAAQDGEAGAVDSLEGSDKADLAASSKRILSTIGLLLRVVGICRLGGAKDRRQMRAGVSKKLSDCARQSHETIHREVVLDILARKFGSREKEDVVFLVGALGVIVEVVHHQACPVLRELNVQF